MVAEIFTNNAANAHLLADALAARKILVEQPSADDFVIDHLLGQPADKILTGPFNATVNGKSIEVQMSNRSIEDAVNDALYLSNGTTGAAKNSPSFRGIKQ
ncbi:MAG: hypothetical protein AAB276_04345 [Pseudomonadota bacterium]